MSEEPFVVHIHSITDTGLISFIVMNCVIDLGFLDLRFGPIWVKGFRISCPTSVAFCRVMVAGLWDRRVNGFELPGIDLCKPYKHNDDNQYRCLFQGKKTYCRLSQSMAMERKAQHVDGGGVVLDLVPLSRVVFQQDVYPEAYYSC
jgi:hypothetical protein